MLKIDKTNNEGTLTVTISGRIDTANAPALENEINSSIGDASELILDFARVDYISSAGLRVLLTSYKAMSKKNGMRIRNVGPEIMEIFEVTGFSDILTIE